MRSLASVVECYACGLFVEKEKNSKVTQRCPRCNTMFKEANTHSIDSLFYAISSLMLFLILTIYPLISLNLNGQDLNANIIKTVYVLFEQDFYLVSFLILFTIIIAPLFNSIIVILVFIQKRFKKEIFSKHLLYDSYYFFKNWGFIEVFIVSLIVTYIKLIGMVSSARFDLGFYILLAYIVCFIMSHLRFNASIILED